jgi:hypothetical protein
MASVVFPLDAGPTKSTACGAGPMTIERTAASARGWPRVTTCSIGNCLETSASLTVEWREGDYSPEGASPAGFSATGSVVTGLRRAGARR